MRVHISPKWSHGPMNKRSPNWSLWDFKLGRSGGLGVNEITPVISQGCLGHRPNCHQQEDSECGNTRRPPAGVSTAHQDLNRPCKVASQQNPPSARAHHLVGCTWDSHIKFAQCPCHSQNNCMRRCWTSRPSCPLSYLWLSLDHRHLLQYITVPAACAWLSWAVNTVAEKCVCKECFSHSLESRILHTVSVQHVELEKTSHLNKVALTWPGMRFWFNGCIQARMSEHNWGTSPWRHLFTHKVLHPYQQ